MKPMRWPHRLAPAVVAVVALGVSLAGCSSNGKSATGATGAPQSSSAKTPTGSVIKIGVIGSNSGPQASSASQGATVGPAWAEYVNNDLGGINGHRVEVISVDDKGDPIATQAAAKQLINDGVVAVVAAADNLIPTSADSMIAAKVPVVITFTAGKPTPFGSHPCAFVVGVKNGKTITPDGLTPLCPGGN